MKRTFLAAALLCTLTGCNMGQRRSCSSCNPISWMRNAIHGTSNVGAPCASGTCAAAPAPYYSAPAVVDSGCETCGSGAVSMGYEDYSNEAGSTYSTPSMGSTVYGGMQGEAVSPMVN